MTITHGSVKRDATASDPIRPAAYRPDSAALLALAWRVGLVMLATVTVLLDLPAWLRTPLTAAAALVTLAFFVSRYRRRGILDSALTAVGSAVVLLVLLGFVLNLLPGGLIEASWAIGIGLVEAGALVALAYWRGPIAGGPTASASTVAARRAARRLPVGAIVWTALTAAVLAGALIWSVDSFGATHVAPLAIGGQISGDSVIVTVTSGGEAGPYELDLVSDDARTVLAAEVIVDADSPLTLTIPLPTDDRVTVQLVEPGSTEPVREVVLDTIGEGSTVTG